MHVKGIAWLARAEEMVREVGAERWAALVEELKPRVPFLSAPVMPISRIPVDEFLTVNDEAVQRFFGGDEQVYWRFGVTSAEWALSHQLRGLFAAGEWRRLMLFTPNIYKNYFDGGELVADVQPAYADIVIRGIKRPHLYFEYSIIGFAKGALAVLGAPVEPERLSGFSKGDAEIRYRFALPT